MCISQKLCGVLDSIFLTTYITPCWFYILNLSEIHLLVFTLLESSTPLTGMFKSLLFGLLAPSPTSLLSIFYMAAIVIFEKNQADVCSLLKTLLWSTIAVRLKSNLNMAYEVWQDGLFIPSIPSLPTLPLFMFHIQPCNFYLTQHDDTYLRDFVYISYILCYFLPSLNNAAMNMCIQVFGWTYFLFSWVYT